MNPITAPVVRNLSGEKEQFALKLNKKKIFLKASASIHHQQRILIFTFPESGDSITKVKMVNCIFSDQVKKQNFSTFHMRILGIFADVILVRAETIKSFAIYFTICWIIVVSNNRGAPLLG